MDEVCGKRTLGQLGRIARYRAAVVGGFAALAVMVAPAVADAAIDFDEFTGSASDVAGEPVRQAGAHPDVRVKFTVPPQDPDEHASFPIDRPHRLIVDSPAGLVGNPRVAAACAEPALKGAPNGMAALCPVDSQVGVAHIVNTDGSLAAVGLFNVERPADAPAMFAFNYLGVVVKLTPSVRAGDYGISIDSGTMSQGIVYLGADVALWGVPADPAHDPQRVFPGSNLFYFMGAYYGGGAQAERQPRAMLSLGTECSGERLVTRGRLDGWGDIGAFAEGSFDEDDNGVPFVHTGCDRLPFEPSLEVTGSSARADAPTGLSVDMRVSQSDLPERLATAHVKDVRLELPQGVSVSPSSAVGLGACSPAQIDLATTREPTCPQSSKLGTATVDTPLLDEALTGEVILATPDDNPFGSLISLYLVVRGPGVLLKVPGRVDPNPTTGQLTATFQNNPQLPFDRLRVRFDGGDNASLATPTACGQSEFKTQITSWSGRAVDFASPLVIDDGCGPRHFAPSFEAGTVSPTAGSSSPFSLAIGRADRTEELSTLESVKLPQGLLGNASKVPLCDSAAADNGSCPAESRIGHVQVSAGPGRAPVWVPQAGKSPTSVSLAGPYKGAPYSLSVVVPAQAGPFDLGRVVVRSPLHLDRRTAQLSTGIDVSRVFDRKGALTQTIAGAMPTIIEGIPLRVKDLRVIVDRKDFTVNPTSCAPKSVDATLKSVTGQAAVVGSRFQVGDCQALGFTPKLGMRLTGKRQTKTGTHPGLRAVLSQGDGQANISSARVVMPRSVVLDPQNSVDPALVCGYDEGEKANCPDSSVIGTATAVSPLLKKPLAGKVHLVQGIRFGPTGNRIRTTPSLLVKLRGEVSIDLHGRTTAHAGRLVTVFNKVPDARVSKFSLSIKGGKKGILVVTRTRAAKINVCDSKQTANVALNGHNGKRSNYRATVKTPCAKKAKAGT
jgi:hypothetical protein